MTSITSVSSTPSGGLSRQAAIQKLTALSFLTSPDFTSTPAEAATGIIRLFSDSRKLRDQFVQIFRQTMDMKIHEGISIENGAHIALYETIMQNRGQFPAESFKIRSQFPDSASIETTIPSVSEIAAARTAADAIPAEPATDRARTGTLSKIVSALVLDHGEAADRLPESAATTEAQMARLNWI